MFLILSEIFLWEEQCATQQMWPQIQRRPKVFYFSKEKIHVGDHAPHSKNRAGKAFPKILLAPKH
jgi:hypothetical protein